MNPSHVDPRSLALFLAVVDGGSVTAGARQVHLSLAAASTRLQELEHQLGVRLLQRSRQGVALTPAGQELLPHARTLLADVERLRQALAPYSRGLRGRIRLAANTAAVHDWLPDALAGFLAAHPDVDVDVREQASPDILAALRDGRADLGVLSQVVDTTGLRTWPLYTDQLVVAGTAHTLAALPAAPTLRDCAAHPLVGLPQDAALSAFLLRQAASAGVGLHHRTRLGTAGAVLALVAAGAGLAVLPERAVARAAALQPALGSQPLADAWARRDIVLCAPPESGLPAFVRNLLAHLVPAAEPPAGPTAG